MTSMTTTPQLSTEDLASATKELAKLPLLGPVLWLYARDPQRKHTFVADKGNYYEINDDALQTENSNCFDCPAVIGCNGAGKQNHQ